MLIFVAGALLALRGIVLLALAGMAALPLVALPCLALIRPSDSSALASLRGIRAAQTVARAPAIAYLARIGWVAVRTSRATSRLAVDMAVAAAERPTASGPATHVVASARPFADTLGGRTGGVVVSRGLLALLDRDERDAVLAHERAHLRLHHHRLLWFGQVVSGLATAAVGLLDAGLLAILGGAIQPTNPLGDIVLFGLALAGIGWLSWRVVAPLERPAA